MKFRDLLDLASVPKVEAWKLRIAQQGSGLMQQNRNPTKDGKRSIHQKSGKFTNFYLNFGSTNMLPISIFGKKPLSTSLWSGNCLCQSLNRKSSRATLSLLVRPGHGTAALRPKPGIMLRISGIISSRSFSG